MVQAVDSSVRKVVYEFLDELRESGTVNMFGASSYLESYFDIDSKTARIILSYWMQSYSERHA